MEVCYSYGQGKMGMKITMYLKSLQGFAELSTSEQLFRGLSLLWSVYQYSLLTGTQYTHTEPLFTNSMIVFWLIYLTIKVTVIKGDMKNSLRSVSHEL